MMEMVEVEEVDLSGAEVTVLGLARSGIAACQLLSEAGARGHRPRGKQESLPLSTSFD